MKKVLTVLLVMAVMFTFSFTTAFATATDYAAVQNDAANIIPAAMDQQMTTPGLGAAATNVIQTAQQTATNQLEGLKNAAIANPPASTVMSKEAYQSLVEQLANDYLSKINQAATDALTQLTNGIIAYQKTSDVLTGYYYGTTASVQDGYVPNDSGAGYICFGQAYAKIGATLDDWAGRISAIKDGSATNVEEAKFVSAKTAAIAAITAYDVEKYTKDDAVKFGDQVMSSYAWATYAKNYALAKLQAMQYTASTVTSADVEGVYKVENVGTAAQTNTGGFFSGIYYKGNSEVEADKVAIHPPLLESTVAADPATPTLKTVTVATTDAAKIEYAKTRATSLIKAAIENVRNARLDEQNQKIFRQSVSTYPNQSVIDAANEEIAKINAKYDALVEVMTYRLEHAIYDVDTTGTSPKIDTITLCYPDDKTLYKNSGDLMGILKGDNGIIAVFSDGALQTTNEVDKYGVFAFSETPASILSVEKNTDGTLKAEDTGALAITADQALAIKDRIAELQAYAELMKKGIAVDGATAVAVDEELAQKTDAVYMTGNVGLGLDPYLSSNVVHRNAHGLIGTLCENNDQVANNPAEVLLPDELIKINGQTYHRLRYWDDTTTTYSPANRTQVKSIISDAEDAIIAATTVEEADQAFLSAKAAYDAVPTRADQARLFGYTGALYGKDFAARAEINSYIAYKTALMGDTAPTGANGLATTLNAKFHTAANGGGDASGGVKGSFLEDVVDEASLNTAIADTKAFIDGLKTVAQLKEETAALQKAVNEIPRPVTLEQEETVLALLSDIGDEIDYCKVLYGDLDADLTTDDANYNASPVKTPLESAEATLKSDKARLASLFKPTVDAEQKALGAPEKVTLAQKDAVDTYLTDVAHYRKLSGTTDTTDTYTTGKYSDQIWHCQVVNVETMIAILPTYPTAEEAAAAKAALDELGFEGLCDVEDTYLQKLNKFTQDADVQTVANVKALKIVKVHSTAGKGYIKIYWSTKGDTTGVEGYDVYRSTKMNSGYGTKPYFTAKSTAKSYKNTKSLKKGTRYYYKVRAFATVNGEKITSDFSNKAYRKAK